MYPDKSCQSLKYGQNFLLTSLAMIALIQPSKLHIEMSSDCPVRFSGVKYVALKYFRAEIAGLRFPGVCVLLKERREKIGTLGCDRVPRILAFRRGVRVRFIGFPLYWD